MVFRPMGDRAVLIELAGTRDVHALHMALLRERPPGVTELVPASRTILVRFDPRATSFDQVRQQVHACEERRTPDAVVGATVEIPVRYDGPDVAAVAELTGLSRGEVVRRHTEQEYVVAFCGFAPGFGYLIGGDPRLHVPRQATPRVRVPPGAVALAGEFTAVYPVESPGGWQLLGRTDRTMWDPYREPPSLLSVGDRVRFTQVADD